MLLLLKMHRMNLSNLLLSLKKAIMINVLGAVLNCLFSTVGGSVIEKYLL